MNGDFLHLVWRLIESVGFIDDEEALKTAAALRPMIEEIETNAMRIAPVTEVGTHRPPCAVEIRVAAGLKTLASRRGAYQRERLNIPVDQCGRRSDFLINGRPTCRAHAGAAALAHMLNQGDRQS